MEPRFQEHFVEAMALPHASAPYPHLSKSMTLPARKTADAGSNGGDSRRPPRPRLESTAN